MPSIRWFSNAPPEAALTPPLAGLALAFLFSLFVGTAVKLAGMIFLLTAGEPRAVAMFAALDWAALFLSAPVLLIGFLLPWRVLVAKGRFGAAQSMALAGANLFLGMAVLLLGAFGDARGSEVFAFGLDAALSYGLPLGLHVWLRLARQHPEVYLGKSAPQPDPLRIWAATLGALLLWQGVFLHGLAP